MNAELEKGEFYICPKCGAPMVEKDAAFFTCDTGYTSGVACANGCGFWQNPEDPFFEKVAGVRGGEL